MFWRIPVKYCVFYFVNVTFENKHFEATFQCGLVDKLWKLAWNLGLSLKYFFPFWYIEKNSRHVNNIEILKYTISIIQAGRKHQQLPIGQSTTSGFAYEKSWRQIPLQHSAYTQTMIWSHWQTENAIKVMETFTKNLIGSGKKKTNVHCKHL